MKSESTVRDGLLFLFENYKDDRSEFLRHFSTEFTMWKDGVTTNLDDLIAHFANLQASAPNRSIHFVDMVASETLVFEQHTVTVRRAESIEQVDVFAKWTVRNGRITACEELTRRRPSV
ncbi:nuclear transport factor 2 family protein [Pseudomonas capsici]|uniref:nuclear transport factor 2 family protein n=1 Tax=Pseudomonas capsici TaxID=2810614 RepID=UPI0019100E53|nr:nuclear transport factor 2 family protein [Pseudomonas capsici]MBX8610896.1 nuclear transport factor 2 family protein [Pseudomonas cichorii]MCV4273903.1 nuclear transport factor 2 family protein [Pseudomonas capsici]GFM69752.1 hypothetical protein PSCICL_07440 [Pseudomonas cichorii]